MILLFIFFRLFIFLWFATSFSGLRPRSTHLYITSKNEFWIISELSLAKKILSEKEPTFSCWLFRLQIRVGSLHSLLLANQLTNAPLGIPHSQFWFSSKRHLLFLKMMFYQIFWFLPKTFFCTPSEQASVARFCQTDAPDQAQSTQDASFEVLCNHISGQLCQSIQLTFQ